MIRTARLLLRDFLPSDIDLYCQLRSHREFGRFYPESEVSPAKSVTLIQQYMEWAMETPRLRFQLAIDASAAGLIGSCGVRISEADSIRASFGCELGQSHWGHGLALEASRALIGFAFNELGVARIEAETLAENRPAISLARRLGMQIDGVRSGGRRFRGRSWDTVVVSVDSSGWKG